MKKKALILILFLFIIPLFSCSKKIELFNNIYAFGTVIEIKITDDKERIDDIYKNVSDILYLYDHLSDNFREYGNNVYVINNSDDFVEVDERLIELLKYSLYLEDITDGYFNPLVGSISQIYRDIIESGGSVDDETKEKEASKIANAKLIIEGSKVKIEGEAKLDLGAIAKGYAIEKVKEYLINNKVKEYLITGGYSTITCGSRKGDYYKIGMLYDDKILYVKNKTIGCSSINEQKSDDNVYTHIINPFTCSATPLYESVYFIGDDAGLVDGLTTASMLVSEEKIKEFASKYNLEYMIYYLDGKVVTSSGDHYE